MSSAQLDAIQGRAAPNFKFWGSVTGNNEIGTIINALLPYIFGAAGLALLVYMVLGGLQMMTSKGDPKAMQAAQAKITNALLGFVIIIAAFVIVQLFAQLFGIENTLFGLIFK